MPEIIAPGRQRPDESLFEISLGDTENPIFRKLRGRDVAWARFWVPAPPPPLRTGERGVFASTMLLAPRHCYRVAK